jgi:hypothetical protein
MIRTNSVNLMNMVASDQIGSFPDPNAAEAVQRLPGIVVQRDQGEGPLCAHLRLSDILARSPGSKKLQPPPLSLALL